MAEPRPPFVYRLKSEAPPIGLVLSVTLDNEDPTLADWTFNDATDVSAADGVGLLIAGTTVNFLLQTLPHKLRVVYNDPVPVGATWSTPAVPDGISVPGGSFRVPQSGTVAPAP
jgi:hypothetical protein